ncbi:MAG: thiol:disulfide interchange protein DsbG [Gammaproteobacteria bacterium]|nr:thiol:disulfide interchange protein DsbG [Gammaproteobacteria bacterium]
MRNLFLGLTLAGALISGTGWSQSALAAESNQAQAMQHLAESMLRDIDRTTWVSEGKSDHVIYIFFDPNCPFCHRLYENMRDQVKQNKVQLRWIPVGILATTSPGKAAAILGAKDPLQAFYQNEDHYDKGGGIEEDIPSPAVEDSLKANTALLARTGFGAVPLMLFRTKDGTAFLIQGAPPKDKLVKILEYVK